MLKKMKEFNSVQFLLLFFAVFPILASAVTTPTNFKSLIMIVVNLITAVLPVIILLALFYFLWGLAQYLKNAGENREEAQQMMLNGIIGFFVMTAVWGFIGMLSVTFGTKSVKPNLKGAEDYLTGVGIENLLEETESIMWEGLKENKDFKKEFEDLSIPGYSRSGGKNNEEDFKEVTVEVEGEDEEQNSHIPSGFKKVLPWNWGK